MKHILTALFLLSASASVSAQLDLNAELKKQDQKEAALLSAPSDATSKKLLVNYRTVIGARSGISGVAAYGTFEYGSYEKEFKLFEGYDGERALTFEWTYMGKPYTETIVSVPSNYSTQSEDVPNLWRVITKGVPDRNGEMSQERVYLKLQRGKETLQEERFGHTVVSYNTRLRERELTSEHWNVIAGNYAERSPIHFQTVPLFLHDFFNFSMTGLKYIGTDKVSQRDAYLVRRGSDLFYYIDKEKFLLLKWGRKEFFGDQKLEVSYMANSFKRWGSLPDAFLLPSKISIVVKGQVLGSYSVDRIEINTRPSRGILTPPEI